MGVVFEELQKGDGKFAIKDMHLPFKIPFVMRTVVLVHPKRFFSLSFFLLSISTFKGFCNIVDRRCFGFVGFEPWD